MDKIQTAIAKARAERTGDKSPDPAPVRAPAEASARAVTPPPVAVEATAAEHRAALWAALPEQPLKPARMERNRIVAFAGGRTATAVDMMRTRVLQQMRANGWRRLAITSPTMSCGKSTVALNLAFGLSRQADYHTLLMEVDLRRPSLARMLGIGKQISSVDVISGAGLLDKNAVRLRPNLAVSTCPGACRNPAELLNGPGVSNVLSDIEARFSPDVTIFDMPPMLATDDAMAFARHVDCVLLIAAAETTTIKEIDQCERELASQTNVMGVVLNKCRYTGPDYGYSYDS